MTRPNFPTTSGRTCAKCDHDRVVSKREFDRVYNSSAIASSNERTIERGLKALFPPKSRGKGASKMLSQFLDRTPDGDPTHLCTYCYTPTYFVAETTVKSHGPDYDPKTDPAVSDDPSAFM